MWKKFLPLLPVCLLTGCAINGTFTRLTPSLTTRTTNNLYSVEVAFDSQQQSIRWDSVQAFALVNGQLLPLQPEKDVYHRWEGYIPVPATENSVKYRFKFDYLYNHFNTAPQPDSALSPVYTLKVVDGN